MTIGRVKLEFRVLGPVEAAADSVPLDVGGPQQRALLALLLLRANEVVSRDRLIDELWGDAPPATARDTLKVYVGRLRKVFGQNGSRERLVTRGGGYVLQIDPEQLDLHRFQRLTAEGAAALADGDAPAAAVLLREALTLWRGPPLVDLADVPFARPQQARLEEMRLTALEQRIEADLALGNASAVVPELRQLTREHPYRERLQGQLMLALYRIGRQAEALGTYRSARAVLLDELGIEPSTGLQSLERSILRHDPALELQQLPVDGRRRALAAKARRSRRPLVLGVAVLVTTAVVVGVAIVTRADPTVDVRPNSVAIIDPRTNKLVADVAVGRAPSHLVVADGRVWVANAVDGTVVEIAPDTRTATRTIPIDGPPVGFAAAPSHVWLVTGGQTVGSKLELVRIDPRFGEVTRTVRLGDSVWQGMPRQPLAFGAGTVWAAGDVPGTLARRDPTTLDSRGTVDLGAVPLAIAASSDAAWVTTSDNRLIRVDPVTNEVVEDVKTGGRPLDVGLGARAVWIASWSDDVVIRWDPIERSAIAIAVGDGPAAVAVGFGSVWVACSGDGTVWRIDPTTRRVVARWELGASPEDIVAAEGAVWLAVYSELPP